MSIEAINHVIGLRGLTPSEKCLALLLANRHNDDRGYAWPSIPRLAEEAGLTDRGTQRILRRLEAKGAIATEENKGGRGHTNQYTFPMLKGDRCSPFTAVERVTVGTERVTVAPPEPLVEPLLDDDLGAASPPRPDFLPVGGNGDGPDKRPRSGPKGTPVPVEAQAEITGRLIGWGVDPGVAVQLVSKYGVAHVTDRQAKWWGQHKDHPDAARSIPASLVDAIRRPKYDPAKSRHQIELEGPGWVPSTKPSPAAS